MSGTNWSEIQAQDLLMNSKSQLPPTTILPSLPHAVTTFLEKSKDPEVQVAQLASIVETDASLAIEVLKQVNSSHFGLRSNVRSVRQALVALGKRKSTTLLVTAAIQGAVRATQSKLINQATFWAASFQRALFAREVAKLLHADVELAFVGGLLQDFLLPVLTNDMTEAYLEFLGSRRDQPSNLTTFEQKQFGWNHAFAAGSLAHRWCLPDELVCSLILHHRGLAILDEQPVGRTSAAAVAISALIPDSMEQEANGLEQLWLLDSKWKAFDVMEIAGTVDEAFENLGLGLRNDRPLVERCRQPADQRLEEQGVTA